MTGEAERIFGRQAPWLPRKKTHKYGGGIHGGGFSFVRGSEYRQSPPPTPLTPHVAPFHTNLDGERVERLCAEYYFPSERGS
jgi:hypothetical protein